jgi:hypothetical protein
MTIGGVAISSSRSSRPSPCSDGEVEKAYRDEGREPPITTIWGLWFLLPLIGPIIWYVRIQNALNDYWTLHGQTNDPGL